MRTLVRFYNSNIEPRSHRAPVPSAVIHHVDCPECQNVTLAPGQQASTDNGWWERFRAWEEASDAAEGYDSRRKDRPGGVQRWPQCCRHLHNLERAPRQNTPRQDEGFERVDKWVMKILAVGFLGVFGLGLIWQAITDWEGFIANTIEAYAILWILAIILLPVWVIYLVIKAGDK